MLVGSIRLTACSPAFCDATDIPVPETPFTTATATYQIVTNFSATGLRVYATYVTLSGYPFALYPTLYDWQGKTVSGFSPPNDSWESWVTNSTTTATATWTKTSTSIVSANGSWKRPSDGTVLVTGVSGKANQYTFALTSRTGTHTQKLVTTSAVQARINYCDPVYYQDFVSISPGNTASRTPSMSTSSYVMRWASAATVQIAGLNLTLKAAGVSLSPWFVDVAGGSVVLTDKNGSSTSYTGTLSSVAASINAAGNFTAAVPANVTSSALTSDLRGFHSSPIGETTCTTGIPIVLVGDVLAPSTTGAGFGIGFAFPFLFTADLGYPDTEEGLEQFMRSAWYPKFDPGSVIVGDYYYLSGEFDGNLAPGPGNWIKLPGVSSKTQDHYVLSVTSNYHTSDLILATCFDVTTGTWSGCPYDFDPKWQGVCSYPPINWGLGTGLRCDGFPYPSCQPFLETNCWCERQTQETVTHPQETRTVTQTLSGSFVIS